MIDEAIRIDPGNPFLYIARALGYARLGESAKLRDDVNSARRLAPQGWIMPDWMLGLDELFSHRDLDQARFYMDSILKTDPDNWYVNSFAGVFAYMQKDYEAAQGYIDIALANNPQAVYPYPIAVALAQRNGDFIRVQHLIDEVLERFPDPRFAEKAVASTLSEEAAEDIPWLPFLSLFGNFALQQWNDVIADSEEAIARGLDDMPEIYLLQGIAYCSLGDYEAAEASFTAGIEVDPDLIILYMIRADVRNKQGKLLAAGQDTAQILRSEQADLYAPLIEAVMGGENIGCETLFDIDFEALLGAEATPEADE
jgi:tetratricopeptide (TPR) repeat protein